MTIDPKNIPNNISLTALKILCALADAAGQPLNVTGCANAADVHNVSASEMLFKFEQQGLATRAPHSSDRRQSLFTLTKKGTALVNTWQPESLAVSR